METDRGAKQRNTEAQQRTVILKGQSMNDIHRERIYIVFDNKKEMKTLSFPRTEGYFCSYNKTTRCIIYKIYFWNKNYMFRTVPLSITSSFYCTHSNGICHTGLLTAWSKVSANLYDIYHCCVYSEKRLMMDRGTVRNMYSFIPKNKFEK